MRIVAFGLAVTLFVAVGCAGDRDQRIDSLEATVTALTSESHVPIVSELMRGTNTIAVIWSVDGRPALANWPIDSECATQARIGEPLPPSCRLAAP
jgi:hypothetical protein